MCGKGTQRDPTVLSLMRGCCPAVSTKSSDAKAVAQGSQWSVFFLPGMLISFHYKHVTITGLYKSELSNPHGYKLL